LCLVEQKQLATLPIYFHYPATLALKDLGMGPALTDRERRDTNRRVLGIG